jgi:hypothetical protein
MGLFSGFLGGAAATPIDALGKIIDEVYTSDEEKTQGELLKQKLAMKPALVQAEIMRVQATHRSDFVAGARPFLLWVCGLGFLFAFVINPILQWIIPDVGAPEMPVDIMMELTLAMLGLAGLRTVEKLKGFAK